MRGPRRPHLRDSHLLMRAFHPVFGSVPYALPPPPVRCTLVVVPERRHDGVAEACHDEPPVALVTVSASEAERQSIKASGLHDDPADSPPV